MELNQSKHFSFVIQNKHLIIEINNRLLPLAYLCRYDEMHLKVIHKYRLPEEVEIWMTCLRSQKLLMFLLFQLACFLQFEYVI